jgi:nucleosome assembly protein 1-like 1
VSDDEDEDVEVIDAGDMQEAELDLNNELRRLMDPEYAEKFVASLDPVIQGRVRALQGMQASINEIRDKYMEEHKAIEKKYEALYEPYFAKRLQIISGQREPTDEEVSKGQGEDFKEAEDANQKDSGESGISEFWLLAMNNHDGVSEIIEERDEECLKSLTNITAKCFDDPDKGFTIEFHFAENEFFTNTLLTKTYHLVDEDEIVLDKAEGCEIDWKPGKNLTVIMKKKKQRAKGGKQTRTVTKEEPCESFFNFFKPPQIPEDMDDDDDDEDMGATLEELVEQDYEIGCMIKDQIVPKAVCWYTGEAASHDDDDDDMFQHHDDDDDDSDSDADPRPKGGKKGGKKAGEEGGAQQQPECKQQ